MPSRAVHLKVKVLVAVLSAWVLSGCITSAAPARVLPREAFASVVEVALAVGDDGFKHHVWSECAGTGPNFTCVLVYARTASGGVIYSHAFVTPIGTYAANASVAVASSGDAYVVRSECTGVVGCVDYWSLFPAEPDGVFIDSQLLHQTEVESQGPPQAVARGNDVYAAYFIDVGGQTRLRYRQLSGGSSLGYVDTTTMPPSDLSLAVDSGGNLHAAWVRSPITGTFVAYANNIGTTVSFNPATSFSGAGNAFSRPDLALDSVDRAYVAYALAAGAGETVQVRCLDIAADCYREVTVLTVPTVDGPWGVWGNANLAMDGLQPNVVFAAIHDSLSSNDIWWYHPPDSGPDPDPTRVTSTAAVSEGEPLIVKENSTSGDVPVIGWRTFQAALLGANAPADANAPDAFFCYGDVFVAYGNTSTTRQVFEDRGTCQNAGFDLAANGAWVAGVWVDEESDAISAHAAWTAFNARLVNVPVVMR